MDENETDAVDSDELVEEGSIKEQTKGSPFGREPDAGLGWRSP